MTKRLLMIFVKNLRLGYVKTRLAKSIGDNKALAIYKELIAYTAEITTSLSSIDKVVYYSKDIVKKDLFLNNFDKQKQSEGDLGSKMFNAFKDAFNEKRYQQVVIIGSDMYNLTSKDILQSFIVLDTNDFVIGPSEDGGYYLLGMKKLNKELFQNKKWGTSSVLPQTLNDLKNFKVKMLEAKNDIDTFEDLQKESQLINKLDLYDK